MRNKSTLAFYTFLFSLCILLFSSSELAAQENDIYEVNGSNSMSKTSSKKGIQNDREDFYDLAFNLRPTAYIENNVIRNNRKGGASVSKLTFIDTKSFNILSQSNQNFNDIELISIKLESENDLNNKINLTQASGFSSLKYVFVKCYFKCTEQQVKGFITADPNVRIFYKTEKPS